MAHGFIRNQQIAPNTFTGAQLTNQWSIATVTSNYSVGTPDQTIECDATNGSFTVTLPATPTTGEIHEFPRADSSANTVTIDGNGQLIGDPRGNLATVLLGKIPACLILQYNGTLWRII